MAAAGQGAAAPTALPKIRRLEEHVVNRIAAGEIIHRPSSALKEMLENSLDAGATTINVLTKQGGLKLLQIQDNGHGIRPEDFGILCERFTTSKLQQFDDLQKIATFGFRGEALASITHVAHLSVTSMTPGAPCAHKAHFVDGALAPMKPGDSAKPKRCAGLPGTQIAVEDLFYNMPLRRKALRSPSDEYHRIVDVMTKYAVHFSGVSFSCKKHGEHAADLHTTVGSSVTDNIAALYGQRVSRELLEFKVDDDKKPKNLDFRCEGQVSGVNFNMKKAVLILFINNRLVESTDLKKAIDAVYSPYLPKGSHPFAYLKLDIPPADIDVNVHPTKREVKFLNEAAIIDHIQECLDALLQGGNESRTFYTQMLLTGVDAAAVQQSKQEQAAAAEGQDNKKRESGALFDNPAKKMRVDATQRTDAIEAYITTGPKPSQRPNDSQRIAAGRQRPTASADGGAPIAPAKMRKVVPPQLDSVRALLKQVSASSHAELYSVLRGHVYVGAVDNSRHLLQHQTQLYMVDTTAVCKELFYQEALRRFSQVEGRITLKTPLPLQPLVLEGIQQRRQQAHRSSGTSVTMAAREAESQDMVELLLSKAEMIEEYFAIRLSVTATNYVDTLSPASEAVETAGSKVSGTLHTLPVLVEQYEPYWGALPDFLVTLAVDVDWTEEQPCFDGIARALGKFYSVQPPNVGGASNPTTTDSAESGETDATATAGAPAPANAATSGTTSAALERRAKHVIFPALRSYLEPPTSLAETGAVLKIASTASLYRVFERC